MSKPFIKPQILKGFRDSMPSAMLVRERLIDTARQVYRSFGFTPIDTPALEYTQILLGKGGEETDKQLFRFTDQGERDVAMRFDLTVPLARYCAQHFQELVFPFKPYHIAPVWRAEKPQKGRFREFMQCDFDTVGTESNAADIETALVIHDLLERLGFSQFTIRVNHRFVLNGLLETLGLSDQSSQVLRALDKLAKAGPKTVLDELTQRAQTTSAQAERILAFAQQSGNPEQVLAEAETELKSSDQGREGVARLSELLSACRQAGVPAERLCLDLSIARGLDYYTGTVYETFLTNLPEIGSVCSGGRYDHLAQLFTEQPLPGVGASLGLDRLLAAMQELGLVPESSTSAPVLVTVFEGLELGPYLQAAGQLRRAGIATEVFPEKRAIGKQLKYASRKGFRIALIAGDEEFANGTWQVKDLQLGQQAAVPESGLVDHIRRILDESP